jgi:hypothetical protein
VFNKHNVLLVSIHNDLYLRNWCASLIQHGRLEWIYAGGTIRIKWTIRVKNNLE